jgi:hypothetical protein
MLIAEIDKRDLLSEMSTAGRGVSIYGEGEPPLRHFDAATPIVCFTMSLITKMFAYIKVKTK